MSNKARSRVATIGLDARDYGTHSLHRTKASLIYKRTGKGDLSGAIGLGEKTDLLEELTKIEAADASLRVERGRGLLEAAEQRLRACWANGIHVVHRHGDIVETGFEREAAAHVVIVCKRGASHEFATDHIGSKVERVVRAGTRPVLIASQSVEEPRGIVFAYDASWAATGRLSVCRTRRCLLGFRSRS